MRLGHQPQTVAVGDRRAERHEQVHVASAGAHGLEGGDVEPPADDELHGRGERQLNPRRQGRAQHGQQQGRGERQRGHEADEFKPTLAGLRRLHRRVALGVASQDGRLVARRLDRGDEIGGPHEAGDALDIGLLAGEIDLGPDHAARLAQRGLDAAGTGGAGHAADGELQCFM